MSEVLDRERAWNIIGGAVVAASLDTATKMRLLAEIDATVPTCEECNVLMRPETFKCPNCGPTP